jgi:membrane-bound serine protease (ClpP class)
VSTLIGIFVAFAFFEWPWRGLILVGFLLFDALEIWVWLRWRKRKSITGAESLVGKTGKAITDLHPEGQVKVYGQTWKAESMDGTFAADDEVEVVGWEGLTLHVRHPA